MFIRLKKTSSEKTRVQICECIREGKKVRQVIVRHVGIAKDEKHIEELKHLALLIKAKIKEEREGPFLFAIEQNEKVKNKEDLPKISKIENSKKQEKELVDLDNLTEGARVVEGFHDIFGPIFDSLGFNSILHKKKVRYIKTFNFSTHS